MKVYLTESQLNWVIEESMQHELLNEAFNGLSLREALNKIPELLKKGIKISVILALLYASYNLTDEQKQKIENFSCFKKNNVEAIENVKISNDLTKWEPVDIPIIGTVYNAVPNQCNVDCGHTASMFRLNLSDVLSHRVVAMERTLMAKLGVNYGDVIKVEGAGEGYDGIWVIQDTMNKKYANIPKIDFLVPRNITRGKWDNLQIYLLKNKNETEQVKSEENLAPQLSKEEFQQQQQDIRLGRI